MFYEIAFSFWGIALFTLFGFVFVDLGWFLTVPLSNFFTTFSWGNDSHICKVALWAVQTTIPFTATKVLEWMLAWWLQKLLMDEKEALLTTEKMMMYLMAWELPVACETETGSSLIANETLSSHYKKSGRKSMLQKKQWKCNGRILSIQSLECRFLFFLAFDFLKW